MHIRESRTQIGLVIILCGRSGCCCCYANTRRNLLRRNQILIFLNYSYCVEKLQNTTFARVSVKSHGSTNNYAIHNILCAHILHNATTKKNHFMRDFYHIHTVRVSFERASYAQCNLNLDRASSLARKKNNE